MPFRACTITWRKPHADNLLEDECLWHQCSTWRISESNDENLRGLEGIMMTALKKQQLAMTRNCLPCESEADGRTLNLIRRSSGWRRLNCSTCIWVWPNRQRIYTWPQETRLCYVHTCPNQQRWIEKTTRWCSLSLTIFRRFFNQVRTTESSAEEQQFLYLGIK